MGELEVRLGGSTSTYTKLQTFTYLHPLTCQHAYIHTYIQMGIVHALAYEKKKKKSGMVAYTCNPSTGEVEAGTSLKFPSQLVLLNCELWV